MRKMIATAVAALSLMATATLAWAGMQDFTIVNNTGHTILTLNVSPSEETQWGPDILGVDVLPNGQRAEVTFDRAEDRCEWDVRVTYDDGDTGDWRNLNLCEISVIELS